MNRTHGVSVCNRRTTAIVALAAIALATLEAHGQFTPTVESIDWVSFDASLSAAALPDSPLGKNGRILLNTTRYSYDWLPGYHTLDSAAQMYVPRSSIANHENRIRPGAMAAVGLATMLKTNLYDANPAALGTASRQQIATRTAQAIKGLAYTHVANGAANSWGNEWQSALWAAEIGQAGWMMWDELDDAARGYVVRMVEHEANRFLEPGYQVPFWNPASGDSKAEENAWNSMIMQTAVAMMPNHVHANEWRRIGSELMVTAFSRPSDMTNSQVIDGRSVADWIDGRGYNARQDGVVINHNRIHPDYMATTSINTRAYLTQSLAGQAVPESAAFNADVVWRSLVHTDFDGSRYAGVGGTIYRAGQAEVYYPEGNDWSNKRLDIYYLLDATAEVFAFDAGSPDAAAWMNLRADYILALQARSGGQPGQTYRSGDWLADWAPKEQQVAWQMGDAYLLQWLAAQERVMDAGNWIPSVFVEDPGFENFALNPGTWDPFSRGYVGAWKLAAGGDGNLAGLMNGVGVAGISEQFDPTYFNGNHRTLFVNSYDNRAAPTATQTLSATLDPTMMYRLSVDVGSRGLADDDAESYRVQLLAGDVVLGQLDEGDHGAPALVDGHFLTIEMLVDPQSLAIDLAALATAPLEIRLTNPLAYGGPGAALAQTLFDNVRLAAFPAFDFLNGVEGDINQDGWLTMADIEAFRGGWRTTGHAGRRAMYKHGDLNFDGLTDLDDVFLFRQALLDYDPSLAAAFNSVPEPGTSLLALAAIVSSTAFTIRRKRALQPSADGTIGRRRAWSKRRNSAR